MSGGPRVGPALVRGLGLIALCALALQIVFLLRIAAMTVLDPQSTTFQRSEAWRLRGADAAKWQQRWLDYDRISPNLKRAVVASEDAGFVEHSGVEWDALEKAWQKNRRAEAVTERQNERVAATGKATAASTRVPKVVGGSTITQQLAKNLFLGGERNFVRKGQELVLAWELEALLGKRRILEIYLNSVEWGEGVFGADAAAQRYFNGSAATLSAAQAARLAVMLPAPKRFEKRPGSPYVLGRASTIAARLGGAPIP